MMMTYRGYVGLARWDDASREFFGRIRLSHDVVTFRGGDTDATFREMQGSVDDYMEFCGELGKSPEPPIWATGDPPEGFVQVESGELPPATPERLAELLAIQDGLIDTSDIPERTGLGRRVVRDADGRLPGRDGG